MGFGDEHCLFCGRAAHLNVGGEGNGLVSLPEDEPVGRVCEACAGEKLDGVPNAGERDASDAGECVVCGADADYAHVGLTAERTAEGEVPVVERTGEETPILCERHFEEFRE